MKAVTGPAWPDRPKSLSEQLQVAVAANQCEALILVTTIASGPGRVKSHRAGDRCEDLNTKLHPTLGKRLCYVHAAAAENFERTTALRFVETGAGK
jgi:hypothetical protein